MYNANEQKQKLPVSEANVSSANRPIVNWTQRFNSQKKEKKKEINHRKRIISITKEEDSKILQISYRETFFLTIVEKYLTSVFS